MGEGAQGDLEIGPGGGNPPRTKVHTMLPMSSALVPTDTMSRGWSLMKLIRLLGQLTYLKFHNKSHLHVPQ